MAVRKKSKPAGIDKEEQFTGLLNILPDVVMIHKEGIIIYANQAALIATGCTQQELVGSNLLNYVVNDYKDTIIKKMQLREKGENSGDYVCELIKKSGEIRTAIVRSSDIFFNNEPAVLFILIDITNHIKVETALKLNNQKLEAILSSTPDGIGMVSLDGKMQFMSDKLLEIYGYPLEMKKDLVGRNSIDFLDQSEHARLYQNMQKLIHGKSERNLSEYLAVKKDSSTFYVELNSTILFDFDGNPEYILFVGREITKRKMAEAEYRQHSEEISALYETSRDLTGLPMDLNKLLTTITQRAISLLKGFYGGVYLYDKEQGDLFLAIETIPSNLAGNHVKFGQGIAGIGGEPGLEPRQLPLVVGASTRARGIPKNGHLAQSREGRLLRRRRQAAPQHQQAGADQRQRPETFPCEVEEAEVVGQKERPHSHQNPARDARIRQRRIHQLHQPHRDQDHRPEAPNVVNEKNVQVVEQEQHADADHDQRRNDALQRISVSPILMWLHEFSLRWRLAGVSRKSANAPVPPARAVRLPVCGSGAGMAAVQGAAETLGAVGDQLQTVPFGDRGDGRIVRRLTEQVDRDDRPRDQPALGLDRRDRRHRLVGGPQHRFCVSLPVARNSAGNGPAAAAGRTQRTGLHRSLGFFQPLPLHAGVFPAARYPGLRRLGWLRPVCLRSDPAQPARSR